MIDKYLFDLSLPFGRFVKQQAAANQFSFVPDSPEFLRKCRYSQFSCEEGAGPACMNDLVVKSQAIDIVELI